MMTPKERAAMQQALEALEKIAYDTANPDTEKAITALREALVERSNHESELMMNDGNYRRKILAEQEPVAYYVKFGRRVSDNMQVVFDDDEILYAAPVRTKDLTDDEISEKYEHLDWGFCTYVDFARAVIAADREKNK